MNPVWLSRGRYGVPMVHVVETKHYVACIGVLHAGVFECQKSSLKTLNTEPRCIAIYSIPRSGTRKLMMVGWVKQEPRVTAPQKKPTTHRHRRDLQPEGISRVLAVTCTVQ